MGRSRVPCYCLVLWLCPVVICDKSINRLVGAMRQELFQTYIGNDTENFLNWCEKDSAQSKCFTELKDFLHFRKKSKEFEEVRHKSMEHPEKGASGDCKIVEVMGRLNSHIVKMDAIMKKMIERNEIVSVAQNSNLKSYCQNFTKAEEASHMCKYRNWAELDEQVIKKNEEYWTKEKYGIVCHEYRLCIVDWFAAKGETVCNDLRQIAVQLEQDREKVDSVFGEQAPTPSMKTIDPEGVFTGKPNIIEVTTPCVGAKCFKARSAMFKEEEVIKEIDEEALKRSRRTLNVVLLGIGTSVLLLGLFYFIFKVFREAREQRNLLRNEAVKGENGEKIVSLSDPT